MIDVARFDERFRALTGNAPFPWQQNLFRMFASGDVPRICDIPTGLGKTSVIAVWLLARAAGASLPRRLVYIVNRRTVVDQTTTEVERLAVRIQEVGISEPLAISTLRGQMADNREWSEDPSRAAVICGTVDMIGSRLLFSGYRIGFKTRPLHAGFLGQDALLVHDEAHLEPAFQRLVETIVDEQKRSGDPWPLKVMALTATAREHSDGAVGAHAELRLTDEDHAHPVVSRRMGATKKLSLHVHGDRDLVERIVGQVLTYAGTNASVLVFLRTVEDVTNAVTKLRKAGLETRQLTGTMRGYERDILAAQDPVFARFLPPTEGIPAVPGTVALVATSAGEVGINLSADHLVCDLSTFDAMAQRFGRVNRFGYRNDSEVHVFHPDPTTLGADTSTTGATVNAESRDLRRLRTLELLRELGGDASSLAIARLDGGQRLRAFALAPHIVPATEILFDAWAMTTIRGPLAGRPPVSAFLHGVAEWDPPTTQVAWRDEVDLLHEAETPYSSEDLQEFLEEYPLKPHELLSDRTKRVVDVLVDTISKYPRAKEGPVWVIDEDGTVTPYILGALVGGDQKKVIATLAAATLLLPAGRSRPIDGHMSVEGWAAYAQDPATGEGLAAALVSSTADVADFWLDATGKPRRKRTFDGPKPPEGMRLIRSVLLREKENGGSESSDVPPQTAQRWYWYEQPRGGDDDGSLSATRPVRLDVHNRDVERAARTIVKRLPLSDAVKHAVVLAAKHHDDGKARRLWQRSIGNTEPGVVLGKGGPPLRPFGVTTYRHELGSIVDAERTLRRELNVDDCDLVLHLIAAHHGRARPHFPEGELFDPERSDIDFRAEAPRIVQRFARLQRRFGRWGLAYLESLVRAADYAASAAPSATEEVGS